MRASSATGSLSPYAAAAPSRSPWIQPVAPLRDKSRFPVAGRSRNQHHPAPLHDLLQRSEAGPRYRIGPHRRNQSRRPFQQASTRERRGRTSHSSGLPPCGAVLRQARRCRHTPRPECRKSLRRLWISRCESQRSRPRSAAFHSERPGVRTRGGLQQREYQPLWPMKTSRSRRSVGVDRHQGRERTRKPAISHVARASSDARPRRPSSRSSDRLERLRGRRSETG